VSVWRNAIIYLHIMSEQKENKEKRSSGRTATNRIGGKVGREKKVKTKYIKNN